MNTQGLFLRSARFTTVALTMLFGNGCAAITQHLAGLTDSMLIHVKQTQDLATIRRDTREALAEQEEEARRIAAERDVQEARIAAERRRLEIEFCQANQEKLRRQIKENIRQSVESKVVFNVEQGMEVGELEVDVEELRQLLKQRDEPQPSPPQPLRRQCRCCDQPCDCGGGLSRRTCPHCSRKPCEAEKKCGGEEALTRLEQQPLRQPLRPAEIPMKLPVRLTFGFQQPEIEAARILRVPSVPNEELRMPCDHCGGVDCDCKVPRTNGDAARLDYLDDQTVPTLKRPPAPVLDLEATRTQNPNHDWLLGAQTSRRTG